ncbi:Leucine-rich repeat-containing protein 40 [Pseudolycoriella hygida]|uniref:Leucine-rich repeat-containing protein 40 n=1 Tax=Pseudolycoriella hygida TaxID=35572 RepID=A0A9Q0RYT8_9DIPT|nr:Leucine-rich repeat-containing protein 40 [Pseudolycoriella hygida]
MEPELTNLLMLEELDLSHNELTSIPEGIGFLVRISKLTLSHNKLKNLPDDMVNIRRLNTLDVMNNDLEKLPANLGELRKLEFIYAQHNDIVELPTCNGCESLKEIHISNNFIKEVPADFCQNLPQLKVLDLRDNKIEKLCSEIAYLQSIMRLDLSNNSIDSLPSSLSTLTHLVSLQLDGNPIRSIRRDIIQGGTVRILKLLRDRFSLEEHVDEAKGSTIIGSENKAFPDRFQMRKARSLTISGKNLKDIPDSVFMTAQEESVDKIDFSKNKLTAFPDGISYLEASLSEMDLSSNIIASVPTFMSQFTRISYLNLSCNAISDLPKEFGLLNTLRELNVSNNKLTKIPECVYELLSLEILLARDNKIEKIDVGATGLAALPKLATLDLANNNIEHVPPELGLLKKILVLEIAGNKFRQPRHQILEKGTDAIMSYLRDRIPQ